MARSAYVYVRHMIMAAAAVTILPHYSFAQEGVEVRAARVCAGLGQQGGSFQGTFNVDNLSVRGDSNGTATIKRDGVDLGKFEKGTYQSYAACLIAVIKLISPRVQAGECEDFAAKFPETEQTRVTSFTAHPMDPPRQTIWTRRGVLRAPLDAFRDLSVACRCQVRREPVPEVNRRDPRTTRSALLRRVAACVGGAC
jgi:hypothetical protein